MDPLEKSSYSVDGPLSVPESVVFSPYSPDSVAGAIGVAVSWSTAHRKSKNVKKHCWGAEHGSVCRGGLKDTVLHTDLAPDNNTSSI